MSSRVIVALDYPESESALAFAGSLPPGSCKLKVGKELFTAAGPALVEKLVRLGFDVFLDLKFHDIPNTVSRACAAAERLGVWMLNVHALGGGAMMRAAKEALTDAGDRPFLIAVTVLTSMSDDDLRDALHGLGHAPLIPDGANRKHPTQQVRGDFCFTKCQSCPSPFIYCINRK